MFFFYFFFILIIFILVVVLWVKGVWKVYYDFINVKFFMNYNWCWWSWVSFFLFWDEFVVFIDYRYYYILFIVSFNCFVRLDRSNVVICFDNKVYCFFDMFFNIFYFIMVFFFRWVSWWGINYFVFFLKFGS